MRTHKLRIYAVRPRAAFSGFTAYDLPRGRARGYFLPKVECRLPV